VAGHFAGVIACLAAALGAMIAPAHAGDPIVGHWVGTLKQDEGEPFETRLTFVSPKGGISRYPSSPCGGMLTGDRKGDGYEYTETITWGGPDELAQYCIGGVVRITVEGNTMKFEWSTVDNGKETRSVGELQRQR
jgi:hypothetical protein